MVKHSVIKFRLSQPANWLITGGCGFIGTSLIKQLLAKNLAKYIRVLDNLSVGTKEDLAGVCDFAETDISALSPQSTSSYGENGQVSGIDLVIGDIRDPDTCMRCSENMDAIIHLAANTGVPASVTNPRLDMECNVIGTFNMLEGARKNGVKRFVFASSGAPAGEVPPPVHEELPPHPVSPYGASKLAGEGYCSSYFKTFGIDTVVLRFSNVYGPGSTHKSSVVAKFIKQALKGEKLVIYGDGAQTRDFIYIDDLISALLLGASRNDVGGETFQIATGRETTLNEITELLLKIFAENGIARPIVEKSKPRLGDVKRNFSDTSKARDMLGWQSKWQLEKGLEETVDWFLRKHKLEMVDHGQDVS